MIIFVHFYFPFSVHCYIIIYNIFYDNYRFLSIFTKSNELYELRYLPTYAVHSSGRNSNNICYLSVSFNSLDNIDDEYSRNILIDIIKELNIKELNLDVEFGEKKLVDKIKKTEDYYNDLLDTDYKITLVSVKSEKKITISVKKLFYSWGGIKYVLNTGFAMYLIYNKRQRDDGILIYFEEVKWSNLQENLKEDFKNHFYIENNNKEAFRMIWYLIAKGNIKCTIGTSISGNECYYLPIYEALDVRLDFDDYI